MCTICYPCGVYASKPEYSSRHHSVCYLIILNSFTYITLAKAKSALSYTIHAPNLKFIFFFFRFSPLRIFAKSNYWLRHVLLSVCLQVSAGFPLEGFPLNFILGTFEKIRPETPHELKIGQK